MIRHLLIFLFLPFLASAHTVGGKPLTLMGLIIQIAATAYILYIVYKYKKSKKTNQKPPQ
jgi:hypothetical protein